MTPHQLLPSWWRTIDTVFRARSNQFRTHDDLERRDSQMAVFAAPGTQVVAKFPTSRQHRLPTSPKGFAEFPAVMTPCIAIDAVGAKGGHQLMFMPE